MANVLIVDDDAFVRNYLRDALAGKGFRMIEACNGDEACRLAAFHRPEVILLDLLMPKRSGLEALQRIRATSPESRLIVISSLDAAGVIQQTLAAGAHSFVAKPFHPLEILAAVETAVRS